MTSYTISRLYEAPLIFQGQEIASVCGRWANGVEQDRYHNLAVYQTDNGKYVLSIQYRTRWPDEPPHDHAVLSQDADGLAEELARYDPTEFIPSGWYGETPRLLLESVQRRYQQQITELLNYVRSVEDGLASPPLRSAVVVEWRELDDDVIEHLQSIGTAEGISAKEVLRRAVEREMLAEGEVCGTVIVRSADDCFDCHARNPQVFFTSKELGYSLCQSCFEARAAKESET